MPGRCLWQAAIRSSLQADDYRYGAILNRLEDFASRGKTIGTAEMIEILRAASRTRQYDGITEYSFIGYPDAMKFALAKEDLETRYWKRRMGHSWRMISMRSLIGEVIHLSRC